MLSRDGDPAACVKSATRDTAPPEGCAALLRIDVAPIVDGTLPQVARACGPHSFWDGSACVRVIQPASVECASGLVWSGAGCVSRIDTTCPTAMHFEGGRGCIADVAPHPPGGPMVRIEGATLSSGDGGAQSPSPHQVIVSTFEIDVTEVTVDEYRLCSSTGKCPPPRFYKPSRNENAPPDTSSCNWAHADRGGYPMNCIEHEAAAWYCEFVGKRLATADEWEFASRGAEGRRYPWGNGDPSGSVCWKRGHGLTACRAGSSPGDKTPAGVLDMAANLQEWTGTVHHSETCDRFGGCPWVVKGGDFYDNDLSHLRGARTIALDSSLALSTIGLRCARTP